MITYTAEAEEFTSESHPKNLFDHSSANGEERMLNFTNPNQILVYVKGSCLGNGGAGRNLKPRGGWAYTYKTANLPYRSIKGSVPWHGPTGVKYTPTNMRADLEAAIAALEVDWAGQGYTSVVFATNSQYVVNGILQWCAEWSARGWRNVKNDDLWKKLLRTISDRNQNGLEVQFWRIPRSWNHVADKAAKVAAKHA